MLQTFIRISSASVIALLITSCSNDKPVEKVSDQPINPVTVKTDSSLHEISFANINVTISQEKAARILSFQVDGKDMLTSPSINENNWGTSFWTSPQSAWGWPPSRQIDQLSYKTDKDSVSLTYTSEKDSLLGYVVTKSYRFDQADTAFVVTYSILNSSDKEQTVAPWEISRVFPGGITVYAMGEGKKQQMLAPFFKDTLGLTWFKYDSTKINFKASDVPKLMSDGKGWLAQIQNGYIFYKKFQDIAPAQAAKGEGEIELYVNPDKSYIEIEQQGVSQSLKPGVALNWEVRWYAKKLPEGTEANINQALADLLLTLTK